MVGGHPTVHQDIPVCAVLILIYLLGAVGNLVIFRTNLAKGHKFLMSAFMFIFCMARVVTFILRLALATRPTNARLAIAATIFTNLGVIIVYIILLLLAVRVFRATHPRLGWNKLVNVACGAAFALLFCAIVLTISFTIESFYTLKPNLRTAALWVQRGAILYLLIFNVIALIFLAMSVLLPSTAHAENFGSGSLSSKLTILAVATFFSVFIAGFRMGTTWSPTRMATNPAWYHSKPAFYVIEFVFEIVIIYLFLITRFDQRFWVPNGSSKPGDYSRVEHDSPMVMQGLEHQKSVEHDQTSDQETALPQEKV